MTDPNAAPLCQVTVHVAAPPEAVWDLVANLSRMGEWSPETSRVQWRGGATGPAVGAKFKGVNQSGVKKWTTGGRIVEAERGKVVSWDVTAAGFGVARWCYRLTPTDDRGCEVTEQMYDHRNGLAVFLSGVISGVKDRASHDTKNMETTLERLKAAAEATLAG